MESVANDKTDVNPQANLNSPGGQMNLAFTKTRKHPPNAFFKSNSGTNENFSSVAYGANPFHRGKSGASEVVSQHKENKINVSDLDKTQTMGEDHVQSIYVETKYLLTIKNIQLGMIVARRSDWP